MQVQVVVVKSPQTGRFMAYCPSIAGSSVTAQTEHEAVEKVRVEIRRTLATPPVVPPVGARIASVDISGN